jgi:glycosyltransferase involved in cell wall biosynthesis
VRLSVIITAYTKRPFIKEAVLSALNQTLKRDKYEVIVVKNYEDSEVDQWLSSKGLKNITINDTSLGGKIRVGLEESRGEIISLLEDDDQFLPSKLMQVNEIFQDKTVVYLRHNYIPFHNETRNFSDFIPSIGPTYVWTSDQLLELRTLNNALKMGISFNNSCISLRREFFEKFSKKLVGHSVAVDCAIFFFALISSIGFNHKFVLLDVPLTLYRLSLNKEKQTIEELFNNRLPDALRTLDMLKTQVSDANLMYYLDQAYLRSQLIFRILQKDTKINPRQTLSICIRLLKKPLFKDFLSSREPNYKFIVVGLASILAHKYVQQSLFRRWEKSYKS